MPSNRPKWLQDHMDKQQGGGDGIQEQLTIVRRTAQPGGDNRVSTRTMGQGTYMGTTGPGENGVIEPALPRGPCMQISTGAGRVRSYPGGSVRT